MFKHNGSAVDDVLFLTTKGSEVTKFSDIFIFVPFVLFVVDSIVLNHKWHSYYKMYSDDDVLFLTTKGTEITKISDVFIFVPSCAFCG